MTGQVLVLPTETGMTAEEIGKICALFRSAVEHSPQVNRSPFRRKAIGGIEACGLDAPNV